MTRPVRPSDPHPLYCTCSRCRPRDLRVLVALFLLSFLGMSLIIGWLLKKAFNL